MSMQYRDLFYEKYFSTQGEGITNLDIALKHRQYYNNHFLAKFLPANKNSKILDIGCGYGALLISLQDLGYSEFTGVDRCPEIINNLQFALKNIV